MPFAAPASFAATSRLQAVTALARALADEHRLRILMLLQEQELCACQIVETFALANSTISKHLSILRQAGLIHARKDGRWIYYALPANPPPELRATLEWVRFLLAEDATARADQGHLEAVLRIDPVALCRRQSGKESCD